MGKISVEMFCKTYKANAKGKDKTFVDFLKKHVVTDYVPYMTKDAICSALVDATCHVKDGDHKIIKINSANRYMLFVMKIIQLYTDIEIEDSRVVEQYDELNKIGAIQMLLFGIPDEDIEFIPVQEYAEFNTLLNLKLDDFRDNEYSITALLYNLKQSISLSEEVIGSAIEALAKEDTQSE